MVDRRSFGQCPTENKSLVKVHKKNYFFTKTSACFLLTKTKNRINLSHGTLWNKVPKKREKGGSHTDSLTKNLMEELNCETVFKIPLFGGIGVSESTVVTWIIIAALTILSIIFVRNLKVENPGKIQLALESLFGWLQDFFDGIMGENGRRYVPYMITVILYIAVANLIGLLGFKPPTKDMNVTAGLAIMSIVLVEFAAIRARGTKGWLKKFMEPMAVVLPINILELFTRPLSLCMRLFGNVLGSFVVMELIKMLVPLLVPIPFTCYFDIFDGLIQAYVFVFLTALYVGEAVE